MDGRIKSGHDNIPTRGGTPYDAYNEKDLAQKAFFESKAFRRLNRSRKLSEVDVADYDAI